MTGMFTCADGSSFGLRPVDGTPPSGESSWGFFGFVAVERD